jgi:type II secretory pathway component GspD/PulD (secretin)
MKKTLLLLQILVGAALALQAQTQRGTLETQVNVNVKEKSPAVNTKGENVAEQFKKGVLYYNAMPSTPATGSAVKVIDSKDDKDYVCKAFKLKTKGIAFELASFLQTTVDLEQGQIDVSVDAETGNEYIVISAPIFQFPWIEQTITTLDHKGTLFAEDGTKDSTYKPKHRLSSELASLIGAVLQSKNGDVYADDKVNMLYMTDAPSCFDSTLNYVQAFDVPPEMIKIEAQIIEVQGGEDFDFGLALEAWKESLPEELNMEFNWDQNKSGGGGGPVAWGRNAAQVLRINGLHPKALANFVNYLVSTNKAKVLSRPRIVATNGETAQISNEDTITYSAYSGPSEVLQKQVSSGLLLEIKPVIGSKTITLNIEATIKSILGYSKDGTPIVNTRRTTSKVVLSDRETFTLSGLRKDTIIKSVSGIPILKDIPLIGYFFKHDIDVKSSKELIVMLKPTKVSSVSSTEDRERILLDKTIKKAEAPQSGKIGKFVDRVILNK